MVEVFDFKPISTSRGYLHFAGGTGTTLTTHIGSINIPASLLDFSAITEAGARVAGTLNSETIGPTAALPAGLTSASEASFNDEYLYGTLGIVFEGTVSGNPLGGYFIVGTLTSPGDVYDGNLSWFDFDKTNNRGELAEALTFILWAKTFGQSQNYNIEIEGSLSYII